MASKAHVVPFLLAAAFCIVVLQSFFAPTFVGAPRSDVAPPQTDLAQTAAVPVFTALLTPGAAEAATTEQQLNRFGFGFAIVFLLFFIAGLARIFTQGKL
mmetsp:Transcript_104554/g.207614  ORF Transcript_104554/g.207614 Transcript_104554/m.207614 type:complete len:100 (-) Transcript_104554:117-416(-)